jgi:hypothetical protein
MAKATTKKKKKRKRKKEEEDVYVIPGDFICLLGDILSLYSYYPYVFICLLGRKFDYKIGNPIVKDQHLEILVCVVLTL